MPIRIRDAEWRELIGELIARNAGEDQYLYLHITRGVAKRDHAFPQDVAAHRIHDEQPAARPPPALRETA